MAKKPTLSKEELKKALAGKADSELVKRVKAYFVRHQKNYGDDKSFQRAKELFYRKYPVRRGRKPVVISMIEEVLEDVS